MAAPPQVVFTLARDVERWPERLPHYRRVVVRGRRDGRILAQMVADRRFGPITVPVTWRAICWSEPDDHTDLRLRFRHVRGVTRGMEVTWHIRPGPTPAARSRSSTTSAGRSPSWDPSWCPGWSTAGSRPSSPAGPSGRSGAWRRRRRRERAGRASRLDHRHRRRHADRDRPRRLPGRPPGAPIARSSASTASTRRPFRSQVAAQVDDFDPLAWMPPKTARQLDRFSQFGLVAGRLALDGRRPRARGRRRAPRAERIGIYLGSALGGIAYAEEQHERYLDRGHAASRRTSRSRCSAARRPANLGIALDVRGPILSTANSCASGAVADRRGDRRSGAARSTRRSRAASRCR